MTKLQSSITAVAGGLLLWAGCKAERQPCTQPSSVSARGRCYQRRDTLVLDSALRRPLLYPVGSKQNIQLIGSNSQNQLSFSLSPVSDTTRWVLRPDSANRFIQDTITFVSTRRLQFVSNACGYTYYYTLREAYSTGVAIDSIRLTNTPEVTNDANVQHLRIYF